MPKDFGSIDFRKLFEQLTNDVVEAIQDLPKEEKEALLAKWERVCFPIKYDYQSDEMGDYTVYCQDGKIVTRKKVRKPAQLPKAPKPIVETQISPEEENTEYIYCEVDLGASRKYSYITDDESIKEGDTVVVPIGPRNLETMGVVANVIGCTGKDAPYPPSKTKRIIRKYDT